MGHVSVTVGEIPLGVFAESLICTHSLCRGLGWGTPCLLVSLHMDMLLCVFILEELGEPLGQWLGRVGERSPRWPSDAVRSW
jgi:hypothetical protein